MQFVRLVVFGFLAMSVVYLCVSFYSRSVRREKLENEWAEANPGSTDMAARRVFVDQGMTEYDGSLRKRLILLVYVIPTCVVATIIYVIN